MYVISHISSASVYELQPHGFLILSLRVFRPAHITVSNPWDELAELTVVSRSNLWEERNYACRCTAMMRHRRKIKKVPHVNYLAHFLIEMGDLTLRKVTARNASSETPVLNDYSVGWDLSQNTR